MSSCWPTSKNWVKHKFSMHPSSTLIDGDNMFLHLLPTSHPPMVRNHSPVERRFHLRGWLEELGSCAGTGTERSCREKKWSQWCNLQRTWCVIGIDWELPNNWEDTRVMGFIMGFIMGVSWVCIMSPSQVYPKVCRELYHGHGVLFKHKHLQFPVPRSPRPDPGPTRTPTTLWDLHPTETHPTYIPNTPEWQVFGYHIHIYHSRVPEGMGRTSQPCGT